MLNFSLLLRLVLLVICCRQSTGISKFQSPYCSSVHAISADIDQQQSISNSIVLINRRPALKNRKSFPRNLINIRGGKTDDSKQEDEDDDNEEEDEEDDDESNVQLGGVKDNAMLNSVTDLWKKTPPITKAYISSSVLLTLLAFFFNKNVWPEFLHLKWKAVLTRFEFWRPLTAFFFYGPLGLNYILTIQFVWTYMAQLEKLSYKSPGDFFVQMVFGAVTLVALYTLIGISPNYLGHNLSTYLVYIWARVFEGSEVNVMDLFNLKAEILPWFFCLQTFILEGEVPFADMLGIVVGHLYHYLSKRKILVTPKAIQSMFDSEILRKEYLQFKDDFE